MRVGGVKKEKKTGAERKASHNFFPRANSLSSASLLPRVRAHARALRSHTPKPMENAPPPRAPDVRDSRPPSSSKPPPQLAARAAREFKMLATDAPPGVAAWPVGNNLTSLRAQIRVRGNRGGSWRGHALAGACVSIWA